MMTDFCKLFLFLAAIGMATPTTVTSASAADEYRMYVSVSGDKALAIYKFDPASGELTAQDKVTLEEGPAPLAIDPKQNFLYAGIRPEGRVVTFRIDAKTGGLTPLGTTKVASDPVYLATDKTGGFLLTAYYGAAKAVVYPIQKDGVIGGEATSTMTTDKNPHSIQADPSNRFVYVPNTGADKILQFNLEAKAGTLTPCAVPQVATDAGRGPRHFWFHPKQQRVYFVNEKGSSVTGFDMDPSSGSLTAFQTIPTLPADWKGNNSCAHIETTPSGKFLYASNRGHDSIACYSVDATTGKLTSLGQQPTEKTPRAFTVDPTGNFLFVAGQMSNQLASYRIDQSTGLLQPMKVYAVGKGPAWVSIVKLPGN
jgi:6-phosphogluconolactonase